MSVGRRFRESPVDALRAVVDDTIYPLGGHAPTMKLLARVHKSGGIGGLMRSGPEMRDSCPLPRGNRGTSLHQTGEIAVRERAIVAVTCILGCTIVSMLVPVRACAGEPALEKSLTFHASFDHGPDADFARGERTLMSATSTKRDGARPGLPAGVEIARGKGRHGDALWFRKKTSSAVFFRAAGNMPYRKSDWSGTISFWLSLDPDKDLEPGYTDPLQITERAWNDAAIWVDFSDKNCPSPARGVRRPQGLEPFEQGF